MIARIIRPKAVVLPDSALLSNRFTHEVIAAQPYSLADPAMATKPDGILAAGTRLLLLEHAGGPTCRVAGEHGEPCYTAFAGLRPLAST